MKKALSVLLACLILAALMIPAFAASVSVTPKAVLSDDGVVTVTLDLPAGADLATFATTLTYDADKLEFSEVKFGAGEYVHVQHEHGGGSRALHGLVRFAKHSGYTRHSYV